MCTRERGDRAAGFTLIEMLVVIIIISILASFVAIGVNKAITNSRSQATQLMLDSISGALEQYRTRWGDYPPSSLDTFKARIPNDTNNGAEALVACLSSSQKGPILYQVSDEQYVNTDNDRTDRNATGWFFGDNQLREYADVFGGVIVYIHHKDYARPPAKITTYKFRAGDDVVKVGVEKSAATSAFWRPDKFQLWSAGADGKPGTPDDVKVSN